MADAQFTSLSPEVAGIAAAIVPVAILLVAALILALGFAQRAREPTHRVAELFGDERVEVVEWAGREGYVRAGGELWRARSAAVLAPGDKVKVDRIDGLIAEVSKPS